ncbi:MAG: 4-alpha-glucanotransferase [Desulfuromonadales bacterium]
MSSHLATLRPLVDDALKILGISNFLLGIHDSAFPGRDDEDLGCGTPYSRGAAQFLRFIREIGFNGVQLGPQGITSAGNHSPYDSTFFSRSPLLLAPFRLTRSPWKLIEPDWLDALVAERSQGLRKVQWDFADQAARRISIQAGHSYRQKVLIDPAPENVSIQEAYTRFRQNNAAWLERDALYEILQAHYKGSAWMDWQGGEYAQIDRNLYTPRPDTEQAAARRRLTALLKQHALAIEDYCFTQFLIASQHDLLRRNCRRLGIQLFGDCQIGMSVRDTWYAQGILLGGYLLGAPPSRTNPDGQPWNYSVLDPSQYEFEDGRPGPVIQFMRARFDKLFSEFDGLRIDHPHGLICPWVYRAGSKDPLYAVQTGARLFASPVLEDHPELAEFAIARPGQINLKVARYDDAWVTDLDSEQVLHYARLFAEIVASAGNQPHGSRQIACEILSTQPYPIRRVMDHYHQGRFRVTQKADLSHPRDVYRSENAQPEDWLMLGNHDTLPIWTLADRWCESGASVKQAEYLSARLQIHESQRQTWIHRVAASPELLVQAKFADLFVGPARNVMVYFTDLFGMRQPYNRPGTISSENWSLRVAPDYDSDYLTKIVRNQVLNIPGALALALRARGATCFDLISALEAFDPF